ncbi:alpha/beta hydrolase [Avibacterium paragallinarum]|uniref:alpha/beta hydrolase n=1 Tax=Avibacterium paragallinarum TaxID=728 RepID=UPI00397CD441
MGCRSANPNGGVKEQVAGLYAQKLAEQGFITIAADAAYQGASGGEPRQTDKPFNRINDVHGMVDFLESFKGVDTNNIGALGICGLHLCRSPKRQTHQSRCHRQPIQHGLSSPKRLRRQSNQHHSGTLATSRRSPHQRSTRQRRIQCQCRFKQNRPSRHRQNARRLVSRWL